MVKRTLTYTAVFEPSDEGGYVVTFPALPHLATQGETLDEARRMAADLVRGYLEVLREEGRPLPEGEAYERPPIRDEVTVLLDVA